MSDPAPEPERKEFRIEDFRADLADYLADLERYAMPFGKFRGEAIYDLPVEYLRWFVEKRGGFPKGRLGELLEFVFHIKSDGAEMIFAPLRRARSDSKPPNRDPF